MLQTSNEPSPGIGPKMVIPHTNSGFISHGLCVPFGLNGLWCLIKLFVVSSCKIDSHQKVHIR